jgi:hypothetical protein
MCHTKYIFFELNGFITDPALCRLDSKRAEFVNDATDMRIYSPANNCFAS